MSRDMHVCPRCCREFFGDDWEEEYEMHTCTPPPKVFTPTEDNFTSAFCLFSHIDEMGTWPPNYFKNDVKAAIIALQRQMEIEEATKK